MSQLRHIEQSVLSEAFEKPLSGQRLVTAVFTTFCFDPGFFEQEVLPVFFDVTGVHSKALRLVQLEDALRETTVRPAVYYDAGALTVGDYGPAKLDVARHPVRLSTGVFHPKMLFALVEAAEPNAEGLRARKLIVACQSANLTRAGWWENVEAGHVLEIAQGEKHACKESLTSFLVWLAEQSPSAPPRQAGVRHLGRFRDEAVGHILAFLDQTEQYGRIPRNQGLLPAQFLWTDLQRGGQTMAEKIAGAAGTELQRMSLEILSPYFDKTANLTVLDALVSSFGPKEIRLYLPRDAQGAAQVAESFYESVIEQYGDVVWSSLPEEATRASALQNAAQRFVHAKVYRFFSRNPKREFWFTGSVNLTTQAHQCGGNMECGLLIERDLEGQPRPEFLLQNGAQKPREFIAAQEPLEAAGTDLSRLALRFDWLNSIAAAHWEQGNQGPSCPPLVLRVCGVDLGPVRLAKSNEWEDLPADISARVKDHLASTSAFVIADPVTACSAYLLVDELNMTHKPSLLYTLTAADILRYWSLLTPEQRSEFLGSRLAAQMLAASSDGQMLPKLQSAAAEDTIFGRLAGVFHGFHAMEQKVAAALEEGRKSQAVARVFGRKHDSLTNLLKLIEDADPAQQDPIDGYVIVLCVRQCLDGIKKRHPDLWAEFSKDGRALKARVAVLQASLRRRILAADADGSQDMAAFLDWFEPEFLCPEKVKPMTEACDD